MLVVDDHLLYNIHSVVICLKNRFTRYFIAIIKFSNFGGQNPKDKNPRQHFWSPVYAASFLCRHFPLSLKSLCVTALPTEPFLVENGGTWRHYEVIFGRPIRTFKKMVSMCKIDVRGGTESLVMIAATLQEISREEDRGAVFAPPPTYGVRANPRRAGEGVLISHPPIFFANYSKTDRDIDAKLAIPHPTSI